MTAVQKAADLRTRIAAVLADHLTDDYVAGKCACGEKTDDGHSTHQADAVIRELNLRPEYGHLDHQDSGRLYDTLKEAHSNNPLRGETLRTRLITDWADVHPG